MKPDQNQKHWHGLKAKPCLLSYGRKWQKREQHQGLATKPTCGARIWQMHAILALKRTLDLQQKSLVAKFSLLQLCYIWDIWDKTD